MAKRVSEEDFVNEGLDETEISQIADENQELAPEPVTDDTPDDGGNAPESVQAQEPEGSKTVDIRALQEARAESREIREQYRRLEERTNAMLQMFANQRQEQTPKQQEDTPPDPNEDIFAFSQWQAKKLADIEGQIAARANQEAQQMQAMQQEQAVWDYWNADAQAFSQQQPDFGEAAKFLSEFRDSQLKALSRVDQRFASEQGRLAQINEELKAIVAQAAQQQVSPAQLVYEIATGYGYKATQPGNVPGQVPNAGPQGIQRMAQQQERHRSLSDASGGEPPKALDAKALANMSDAAWKKLMDDPSKVKEIDQIMGIA